MSRKSWAYQIAIKLLCWWLFTHLVEEETSAIIMCIF
ncbi:acyltransferase [Xanthomonas euvesicatoria]|nr:acyltransferase [Xanthomonas euvesicatoria]WOP49505.1 acyltransferase [Xanthomonas euvesicatoria]